MVMKKNKFCQVFSNVPEIQQNFHNNIETILFDDINFFNIIHFDLILFNLLNTYYTNY
jgi:hypothetical protein